MSHAQRNNQKLIIHSFYFSLMIHAVLKSFHDISKRFSNCVSCTVQYLGCIWKVSSNMIHSGDDIAQVYTQNRRIQIIGCHCVLKEKK